MYWSTGAKEVLKSLDRSQPMYEQLKVSVVDVSRLLFTLFLNSFQAVYSVADLLRLITLNIVIFYYEFYFTSYAKCIIYV